MKQHSVRRSHMPANKPGDAPKDAKKFVNFNTAATNGVAPAESAFVRDEAYEESPGVAQALAAIDARAPVILIAGRAGTGKPRPGPSPTTPPRPHSHPP